MITAKQMFFSIVLVGRQNPQILNHDFLESNGVLPRKEPFYKQNLAQGETVFTEFFSTPPVARIVYEKYSLLVQEDRFQAIDTTGDDPCQSPIIEITKNYFGNLLKYTPFTVGGLNLNCDLTFGPAEEQVIDGILGINREQANQAFGFESTIGSITGIFPFLEGRMSIVFAKPRDPGNPTKVNFNYEFSYPGSMEKFLLNLDDADKIVGYQESFYKRIGAIN